MSFRKAIDGYQETLRQMAEDPAMEDFGAWATENGFTKEDPAFAIVRVLFCTIAGGLVDLGFRSDQIGALATFAALQAERARKIARG